MGQSDPVPIAMRIVIENPVVGVLHSLQSKDGSPLNPKRSTAGEPLTFDLQIRIGPKQQVSGDLVKREGKERRFVYVRVGQSAGEASSPWSRRMKIDIHDIDRAFLERAIMQPAVVELTIEGRGKDGSPACATVQRKRLALA